MNVIDKKLTKTIGLSVVKTDKTQIANIFGEIKNG